MLIKWQMKNQYEAPFNIKIKSYHFTGLFFQNIFNVRFRKKKQIVDFLDTV